MEGGESSIPSYGSDFSNMVESANNSLAVFGAANDYNATTERASRGRDGQPGAAQRIRRPNTIAATLSTITSA